VALEDADVRAPPVSDELLPEIVEAPLEEALGRLESVLGPRLLTLLRSSVDAPAEVVLGRLGDTLDEEAPIDTEMLLVVTVELPGGGEVNGWLDEDTVDSGYGPIALELDAVAEPSVVDPLPLLLPEAEVIPTDDVAEPAVIDPTPLLLLDAESEPMDDVAELKVGNPTPLLLPEAELEPIDEVAELTVGGTAPLLLLEAEPDPATLELLEGREAVVIIDEVVLVTEKEEVVITFPP
jgi:hypothetical protein